MNTSHFSGFPPPHRRADDDPVEDEHGWATYLNNADLARHFPVEFPTGVVVDFPRMRCMLCHRELGDVRGRVRKTAAAAVIEAAALCPDCNDVTGCDVRIRPDGAFASLHGRGDLAYAGAVRVPWAGCDVGQMPTVVTPPSSQQSPNAQRPMGGPLRRLVRAILGQH